MPLPVMSGNEILDGALHVRLELGSPRQNPTTPVTGGRDRDELLLILTVAGQACRSCGKPGWFDDELLEIEAALPNGIYLRCCHYCACANYSPVGFGLVDGSTVSKIPASFTLFATKQIAFMES
jgi:hypothetical protein